MDLQRDMGPESACSGLLLLARDPKKRLEWSKGLKLASKHEFDSTLFLFF